MKQISTTSILCITFVSLFLIATIFACPLGQYGVRDKFQVYCYPCAPGMYCPGNDEAYRCAENYHAPWYSMTACIPCPAERPLSRLPNVYCMPKDTPVESKWWYSEPMILFDRPVNHLLINGTKPTYFHTGLDFSADFLNPMYDSMLVVLSAPTEITAYSALAIGAPTEKRHDEKRVGKVITFLVAFQDLEKDWAPFSPWYVSLTGTAPTTNITAYVQPANGTINALSLGTSGIDADQSTEHMFFSFKNDEEGARYNISVATIDLNPQVTSYCYQYLTMNEADQSEPLPHRYNGKVVAQDTQQHYVFTSYVTTPKKAGNVYFSVFPDCWTQPISMKITVTKASSATANK